jgi:predicted DNA-binding transcriptional regulator YafY
VNRIDRLYALVEELRAYAPRPRTARQLADRFEVSVRTIERDLNALLESGVPLYATPGPGGGYALDKRHTLPPVNFTAEEATAIAVALARPGGSPFADALRSAVRKVVAVMPPADAEAAQRLAGRIRLFEPTGEAGSTGAAERERPARPRTAPVLEDALRLQRVVEIDYEDRHGHTTTREVEPVVFAGSGEVWYLVGYCRLRAEDRVFRLDRVAAARLTGETVPEPRETEMDGAPPSRVLSLLE